MLSLHASKASLFPWKPILNTQLSLRRLRRPDQASLSRDRHPAVSAPLTAMGAIGRGAALSSEDRILEARQHHPVLDWINDSTKWAVSAAAFGTLLLRRDVPACWCLVGSVVCAFNCRVLKYAINHSRPEAARKKDPGMPSAHANSLAFLSTYVSVASAAALGVQGPTALALVFGVPTVGLFLAWLRIALGYHTVAQVVVGWLVGSSSAAAWWKLGQAWLLPALQRQQQGVVWLYGITCAAVAFFLVQNVARWVRERRERAHQS